MDIERRKTTLQIADALGYGLIDLDLKNDFRKVLIFPVPDLPLSYPGRDSGLQNTQQGTRKDSNSKIQ